MFTPGYFAALDSVPAVHIYGSNGGGNSSGTIYGYNVSILGPDSGQLVATFDIPITAPEASYTVTVAGFLGILGALVVGQPYISGIVYIDVNLNGTREWNEPKVPNQQILVLPDSVIMTTNSNGYYKFLAADSTAYKLKWIPDSNYILISPDSIQVVTNSLYFYSQNFGIHEPIDAIVSGRVFLDANGNGIEDSTDYGLANRQVVIMPNNVTAWTNANGDYQFGGQYGQTYTVSSLQPISWFVSSTPSQYTFTLTTGLDSVNFGLVPPPPTIGLKTIVQHAWAPCFTPRPFSIKVKNTGSAFVDTGLVKFWWPAVTPLDSAYPVPNLINGDTLYWYYNNLAIGQTKTFKAWLYIPGPGIVLDAFALAYGISLTDSLAGFFQGSNHHIVTCAYDPNEKEASTDTITTLDQSIYYTIRFQNVGTGPAHDVLIRDTLSSMLNWTTFELLDVSHLTTSVQLNQTNGALAIFFQNIMLPDSGTNEVLSHGHVYYRVKPLPLVTPGSVIDNYASIYFDANPPIVTNNAPVIYCNKDTAYLESYFICSGDSLLIGNSWFMQSGMYGYHTSSVDVCDIFHPVTLTVFTPFEAEIYNDVTTLTATPAGAAGYEWLDCVSGASLGATAEPTFIAGAAGTYAVIVTDVNGCASISDCMSVTLGTDTWEPLRFFAVPNPASEFIVVSGIGPNTSLVLRDITGRVIRTWSVSEQSTRIYLDDIADGIYSLVLSYDGMSWVEKIAVMKANR